MNETQRDGQTMRALVKRRPKRGMTLEQRDVPTPGTGEVRIRVESVGIDGGAEALIYDWHESKHHYEPALPQLFGHEFAGVVDEVHSSVERVQAGERVAVEPVVGCGTCRHCRRGAFAICPDRRLIGLDTDSDGAFAEYVTVPQETLYPIGGLEADVGVFLELLALGVHGLEKSEFELGDRVAIVGPGPVGIGTLVAVVAAGAGSVTVVGTDADTEDRLPLARELGATTAVTADDLEAGASFDSVFETAGSPAALDLATKRVQPGGEIVQIGLFHGQEGVSVDLTGLVRRSVSITTVYGRRASSWRRAIAIAEQVDLSPALGPSFDLEAYESAFEAVATRSGIKVTLHP
ncbi:zinc-dependent alcohol dehydrogenase [Natronorubrum sediminis]|nr:alcohol dehydrogenase catalytic domain-containing protein [Natronorubrum sediminis]